MPSQENPGRLPQAARPQEVKPTFPQLRTARSIIDIVKNSLTDIPMGMIRVELVERIALPTLPEGHTRGNLGIIACLDGVLTYHTTGGRSSGDQHHTFRFPDEEDVSYVMRTLNHDSQALPQDYPELVGDYQIALSTDAVNQLYFLAGLLANEAPDWPHLK